MACDDRQLTEAQRQAAFDQLRNAGALQAIRPFSGQATPENLVDYLNREVYPVLRQARKAVNDIYRQVTDNAPSGNPLSYLFSASTTDADPTAGFLRLDNADAGAATTIRVSEQNGLLQEITPWLDVMAGSATSPLGAVTLIHHSDPRRFARYDLTSMTDQGDYWDLAVTPIEASDPIPWREGDGIVLGFIPGVSSGGTTVPPSSVTSTWADILANGNTSGANNPTISAGQRLVLPGGQSAGAGDIASAADISLVAATDLHLHAGADIHVGHAGSTSDVHVEGDAIELLTDGNGISISSATSANVTAGTSSTIQTATFFAVNATGQVVVSTGGTERLEIEATGAWQLGGAVGSLGQVITNNGAGTPPTWQSLPTSVLTFEDGGVSQGTASIIDVVDAVYTTGVVIVAGGQATMAWDVNLAALAPALAGDGLTGGSSILAVGAGDGIDVNANDVAVDVSDFAGAGLEDDGANNLRIAAAAAGAGLTGGGGSALAVGAGDGIDVNANDVAVDVTDIVDGVSIEEVATNNIRRAALTGDVTAAAGSNVTTIANDAVTNAKAANMAQSTIKGRAEGAGTGDSQDLTPTQVVAIIDGENVTWTGVHSFTATGFTVNVTGGNDISLTAGDDVSIVATDAVSIVATGDVDTTGSDIILRPTTEVSVFGSGILGVGSGSTDGFIRVEGATASTPSVGGGDGMFWVEDPPSSAPTLPKFTDDANTDFTLLTTAVESRTVQVNYVFAADASWSITPPVGATWYEVEGVGGGGGGGGADADGTVGNPEACAGGGGGSGAWFLHRGAILSGNMTGAIGAGGTAGSNTGGTGGTGGNTTFNYGSGAVAITAGGGGGGIGNNGGPNTVNNNAFINGGGVGTISGGPTQGFNGAHGGNALILTGGSSDGSNWIVMSGRGAASFYGGGGQEVGTRGITSADGLQSSVAGSGGSGAAQISSSSSVGAAGATGTPGCLRVTFYAGPVPTFATIT